MGEVTHRRSSRSAWCLLVSLILSSASALAASTGSDAGVTLDGAPSKAEANKAENDRIVQEAREHFNRAQVLYDQGQPEAALLELQRAYNLKPNYRLLYNLGELAFTVHDYVGSQQDFEKFLKEGTDTVEPGKRAEAQSKLVTLQALVGKLRITTNVPGAALSIDDEPVGVSPLPEPRAVNAGRHHLSARLEGYLPATLAISVLGNEVADASITLLPIVAPQVVAPLAPVTPSRWTGLSTVGVVVASALAAGAAGFLVADILDTNTANSAQTVFGSTPADKALDAAAASDQATVNRDQILAISLAGASLVTLGVTLIWTYTHTPEPAKPTTPNPFGLNVIVQRNGLALGGGF